MYYYKAIEIIHIEKAWAYKKNIGNNVSHSARLHSQSNIKCKPNKCVCVCVPVLYSYCVGLHEIMSHSYTNYKCIIGPKKMLTHNKQTKEN